MREKASEEGKAKQQQTPPETRCQWCVFSCCRPTIVTAATTYCALTMALLAAASRRTAQAGVKTFARSLSSGSDVLAGSG